MSVSSSARPTASGCCSFFFMMRRRPGSTLFPYTTLFRSWIVLVSMPASASLWAARDVGANPDRKSTRLNSSHLGISYAAFCAKKKTDEHHHRVLPLGDLPVGAGGETAAWPPAPRSEEDAL